MNPPPSSIAARLGLAVSLALPTLGGCALLTSQAIAPGEASQSQPASGGSSAAFDTRSCMNPVQGAGGEDTEQLNYQRPDQIVQWECFDSSDPKGSDGYVNHRWLRNTCEQMAEQLKGSLTCEYDRKSFDDHYKAEAQKRISARDRVTPESYRNALTDFFSPTPRTQMDYMFLFLQQHPAVARDFFSKVTRMVVSYSDSQAPDIKLVGTTLIFYTKDKDGGSNQPDRNHSETRIEDYGARIMRLFPVWRKAWDDEH